MSLKWKIIQCEDMKVVMLSDEHKALFGIPVDQWDIFLEEIMLVTEEIMVLSAGTHENCAECEHQKECKEFVADTEVKGRLQ